MFTSTPEIRSRGDHVTRTPALSFTKAANFKRIMTCGTIHCSGIFSLSILEVVHGS